MSDPNDKKTVLISRGSSGHTRAPHPPQHAGNPRDPEETILGGSSAGPAGSPGGTRVISRTPPPPAAAETVLIKPSSASRAGVASPAEDLPEGPVVGWLVVVEGPGRGKSVTLGYGMNPIGREAFNRVVLSFGDMEISRTKHATVTYDPRGRKFFIQHGESSNLTYVGESPVLAPMELKSGDVIRLSDTTVLKFIPLCGDDFNWD
jgi:hypothetical protein